MSNLIICGIKPDELHQVDKVKSHYNGNIPKNLVFIPEIFIPIFKDERPFQILRGSRYSGKSWVMVIFFIYLLESSTYFRGIFARQTYSDVEKSQFQLFKDMIKRLGLWNNYHINNSSLKITHKKTGNFIIGGSYDKPESLMSTPEITNFWAEEPISRSGSISKSAFEDIFGTLRNDKGIVTKAHFTFNPIAKDNFIYEDFFHPEKKIYKDSEVNDVLANWYDNPFCPEDSKTKLERMKVNNPTRYEIDGNGNWGEPTNDEPFLTNYNDNLHYNNGAYEFEFGNYETFVSFDFNASPTTASVYQKVPRHGIRGMRCYTQNGGTRKLCEQMKLDKELMSVNKLYWTVTGDSNGKNRTSTGGDKTDYMIIQEEFGLSNNQIQGVYSTNERLVYSQRLCDEFLLFVPFYMDHRMKDLRSDMQKARFDKHGTLFKDRKNGFAMDMFDNWRYFVHLICPNGLEDVYYLRNILS